MGSSVIRYIIPDEDWDAIDSSYWGDYVSPPAHVIRLAGYVLCTTQCVVESKLALFRGITNVQEFTTLESIQSFQSLNPSIWEIA